MKTKLIGPRSFKTVIAVTLAYLTAEIFPSLSPGMMSAAAITAINISIFDSFRSSFDRIMGNLVAIFTAFLIQFAHQTNPVGVFLSMTLIVFLCSLFNWQYAIGSATIFFVFVLEVPYYQETNLYVYSMNRIFDTFIGTVIGLTVNTYLMRPRQEKALLATYRESYMLLRKSLQELLAEDKSADEQMLIDSIMKINANYKHLSNDIKLKMNQNVNTVTVSKLNNLFRVAISLIIDLNDLDEIPVLSQKNEDLLMLFFKGDFEHNYKVVENIEGEFNIRYNYEITKIIHTLESIEYNISEFTNRYHKLEEKWYRERKDYER